MSTSSNHSQSTYVYSSENETPPNPAKRVLNFDELLNHKNLEHSIEQSVKDTQNEMHQKRLQSLRKELEYLKSTEWQFNYRKGFIE